MSQSVPPPGNPFAGGAVPPGPGNPFAPAPPVRDNVGLGLAAAAGTAIVAAAIYGGIAGAIESEIGFAAIGVGFVIGLVAGKVGGRNPVLAVVSAVFALAAVYLGQIFGIAIIGAQELGLSTTEMLFDHFSLLTDAWNAGKEAMTFLFFALAAFAAFSGAKKA
ncbi:hypothetical protein [Streptomyces sp. IB2014 016-6]|uniref:hypothetical protein n=1 Tax=Streptomyces sp. IB2014 016-6 TaxID=2517818 RepID=UPI0011CAE74C|nr:hypothetical protein [Streptomyces sp. IB2014 016-6]TXL90271.1 hypothetical protein EW053_10505 [Streptomyces sp. IB2014 016-6]